MAGDDLKKPKGPAKPTQPGLRIATKTTEVKAPSLVPRWGADAVKKEEVKAPVKRLSTYAAKPVSKATGASAGLASDRTRARMVERLGTQGIRNTTVLSAMREIPRHQFVDEALASRAYEDSALPIGHQQTISQPFVVARVIELALSLVQPTDQPRPLSALEVGCGCGYQAAVMARCFGRVVSVERIKALADLARANLRSLRLSNLKLIYGDGLVAAAADGPFDVILMSAGMPTIPQELVGQIAVGGVLVAPIGAPEQRLVAVQRVSETEFKTQAFDLVRYVPVIRGTE